MASRAHEVADKIRQMILDGAFGPESHLQEVVLARAMGTSRTPVREALKLLEKEQMVRYSANRGYVVRRFTIKDLIDAYDVRSTLEGMACRIVAEAEERGRLVQQLDHIIARMRACVSTTGNPNGGADWYELNVEFHQAIVDATCNEMLANAVKQSKSLPMLFDQNQLPASRSHTDRLLTPRDTARALDEHIQIADAIKAGQSSRAEFLMREHIHTTREAIRRRFVEVFPHATPGA